MYQLVNVFKHLPFKKMSSNEWENDEVKVINMNIIRRFDATKNEHWVLEKVDAKGFLWWHIRKVKCSGQRRNTVACKYVVVEMFIEYKQYYTKHQSDKPQRTLYKLTKTWQIVEFENSWAELCTRTANNNYTRQVATHTIML